MPLFSIVIPCYNEARTLAELLREVCAAPLPEGVTREVIVVDDGSRDASGAIADDFAANHPEVRVLHRTNGGKGAAVRDGFAASRGDFVIVQDADLEYDPKEYGRCLAPLLEGRCKVVYGSRERQKGNRCSAVRFYLGGLLVTWWFNLLFFTHLTDEPTGYKLFAGDLIRNLAFENDDFGWEPEVTAKVVRLGCRIVEVPISYVPRHVAEGKKIRARDGFRALWLTLVWRFRKFPGPRAA